MFCSGLMVQLLTYYEYGAELFSNINILTGAPGPADAAVGMATGGCGAMPTPPTPCNINVGIMLQCKWQQKYVRTYQLQICLLFQGLFLAV